MKISALNAMPATDALATLLQCCHSQRWAVELLGYRPFSSLADLLARAAAVWSTASEADLLEAFKGHARIGDLDKLRDKYSRASAEQGQVAQASETVLQELLTLNQAYEARHGFIFIVCATGKSAEEMLQLLQQRLPNTREQELANAGAEQGKITTLRLRALFTDEAAVDGGSMQSSLSSHVLDLQTGRPAQGVKATLYALDSAQALATGITDEDGRIKTWSPALMLDSGDYQLIFDTGAWYAAQSQATLYPRVQISFSVQSGQPHYHIPLLLSPFGYSTYRGS